MCIRDRTTQDYSQSVLDADKERYGYTASQPAEALKEYQGFITNPSVAQSTTQSESPSLFNTITGAASTLSGLGFFNQGGQVPGYANGVEYLKFLHRKLQGTFTHL